MYVLLSDCSSVGVPVPATPAGIMGCELCHWKVDGWEGIWSVKGLSSYLQTSRSGERRISDNLGLPKNNH